jgi:hypothetical protein
VAGKKRKLTDARKRGEREGVLVKIFAKKNNVRRDPSNADCALLRVNEADATMPGARSAVEVPKFKIFK